MKSIKEKAKRYDKAIERAKAMIKVAANQGEAIGFANTIFPELKESEDEKIRKAIIEYIKTGTYHKDWIAWLEKQGEQKPVDKVEPKFKVGDWVVSPNGVYWHIDKISNNRYEVTSNTGESSDWNLNTNIYHKFDIQDAKDGDVLYSPCCKLLWIYKDEKTCYVGSNLNYNSGSIVINKPICIPTDVHPATKEQRYTLMKAMANAGYTFDFEKKELKKIEQKSAWSEEDEDYFDAIIAKLEVTQDNALLTDNQMEFLKSLKDRIQPQPKQEWNKEDEDILNTIINHFEIDLECTENDDIIRWLKSLSPQSRWKPSEQEKAALRTAIRVMTKEKSFPLLGAHLQNILDAFEGESRVDWKPSKGQMEALKEACNEHYNPKGELYSLYEQLKAL